MKIPTHMMLIGKDVVVVVVVHTLILFVVVVLMSSSSSYATSSDIYCLKTIKASLEDPYNYLKFSWNFDNNTEGFICKFAGIDCWQPDENKVLNIRLSDKGLKGKFPRGIENCSSMTGLDLSNNKLSGPIPSHISKKLQFLTSLDLSSNSFSGNIPLSLANFSYLNVLKLDSNQLTGSIPLQLGLLNRIKTFSVSNNLLSGQVPIFGPNSSVTADSYANNLGLCGGPLKACAGAPKKNHVGIIAAAAIGGATFTSIIVGIHYYFTRGVVIKKEDDPEGNQWAKSIKGTKGIKVSLFEKSVSKQVSLFEKSVSKMRLSDLMKATNNFSNNNIIGTGRTGTMYKALLPDGCLLMVKRLHDSRRLKKEFVSEMNTLGKVKHRNLVPLMGYCMAKKERLVVYKYMENGTLYDQLHGMEWCTNTWNMDWPLRLKIGIGAARGLAWLHHNCNPRIIHRNISSKCILLDKDFEPKLYFSKCILLDKDFEPKLSDLGLARLVNPIDPHLSTFGSGEFGDLGYVAPEYPTTLVATPKGDVYSFGVVLLELITGEKPTRVASAPESFQGSLVEWVTNLSSNSLLQTAIDKSLLGKGFDNELTQFLQVACNCVLPTGKERPTMFEALQILTAIGERYHFTADDEIVMPTNSSDANFPDELIVAQETSSGSMKDSFYSA